MCGAPELTLAAGGAAEDTAAVAKESDEGAVHGA